MRVALLLLLATTVAPDLHAQVPPDHWVVSVLRPPTGGAQGGLFVVDPAVTTTTQPQPQSTAMGFANCVVANENGLLWYATAGWATQSPMEVFVVTMDQNTVSGEVRLTSGPVAPATVGRGIHGLALLAGRVWFVASDGVVGSLDPTSPGQTPTFLPAVPLAGAQDSNAITTDGRQLFVTHFDDGASASANVWVIDPAANTPQWRPVIDTRGPIGPGGVRPARISDIALGPDASLLTAEFDGFVRISNTGTGTTVPFAPRIPSGLNGFTTHPWLGLGLGLPLDGPQVLALDLPTRAWRTPLPIAGATGVASGVTSVRPEPFLRFGSRCTTGSRAEPKAQWGGLPTPGGSFTLRLSDGEPNSDAFLVIGASRTSWLGMALPYDLTALGAPECALRVGIDECYSLATPSGEASRTLVLPPSSVLSGLEIYAQWLVCAPGNALDLLSSEGVAIRIR